MQEVQDATGEVWMRAEVNLNCIAAEGTPEEVLKYFGDVTKVDLILFGVKPLLEYKVVDGQVELYLVV